MLTFGGNGLFSLAALIALMLFEAESSNGALASHSSTPIVDFAGVGESNCVWIRRGGTRVEVIFKIVRTPARLPGGNCREWIDFASSSYRVKCKFYVYLYPRKYREEAECRTAECF